MSGHYFLILILAAYLLGSINSAIIVCKCWGLPSPRSIGSGNPGTTNVLRLGSKSAAIVTLLGDALKAVIPVVIGHCLHLEPVVLCWVGLAAVIGHIFPIFFGFRGGKGVATLLGAVLSINPVLGGIFVLTWLIMAGLFRYSSLAALVATAAMPLAGYWLIKPYAAVPLGALALLVILKHHSNIRRLIAGTETQIGQKAK